MKRRSVVDEFVNEARAPVRVEYDPGREVRNGETVVKNWTGCISPNYGALVSREEFVDLPADGEIDRAKRFGFIGMDLAKEGSEKVCVEFRDADKRDMLITDGPVSGLDPDSPEVAACPICRGCLNRIGDIASCSCGYQRVGIIATHRVWTDMAEDEAKMLQAKAIVRLRELADEFNHIASKLRARGYVIGTVPSLNATMQVCADGRVIRQDPLEIMVYLPSTEQGTKPE